MFLTEKPVSILHYFSGIHWSLKQNVDEHQLIENCNCKTKSPESRMRSQEGSIRHDCHTQRDPEEQGSDESSSSIVS